MFELSEETLKYTVIGLLIVVVILLLILFICCCCFCRKSRQGKSREIKINEKSLVRHYSKTDEEEEEENNNNTNINGFKSLSSENPFIDSSINSFNRKPNSNEYISIPPSIYNANSMNRSVVENQYGSLSRGFLSPNININNENSVTLDMGNLTSQRGSYCSTEITNDSQYMPTLKTIMNYSFTAGQGNERRHETLERKQSKLSSIISTNSSRIEAPSLGSSSIIASSIPGSYASLGPSNMKVVQMIHDNNSNSNLHENSFQSNRSNINYHNIPQQLLPKEHSPQNVDASTVTYPKPVKYKGFTLDNTYQQNLDINLNNLHIGPTFTIKDLEEIEQDEQDCDVNDIDAIVDDAENILDALSHHSFSSSNNQTSLLGNSSPRETLTLSPKNSLLSVGSIPSTAIKNINPMDYDDITAGGMNNGNIVLQNTHSNNKINNFQKTMITQIQPTIETNHLQKIPEGETIQSNYESSYIKNDIGIPNNNIKGNINNRNSSILNYDLKNEELLDKEESLNDLSNVRIHKLDSISKNINSNFLNYKKEQITNNHNNTNNNMNVTNISNYNNNNNNNNNDIIINKIINENINSVVENNHVETENKTKTFNLISPIPSNLSIDTDDFNLQDINLNVNDELSPTSPNTETLDRFKTSDNNNSVINSSFTSIKSPTNFFSKSPISPISNAPDDNVLNVRSLNHNYGNKENVGIYRINSYDDSMHNHSYMRHQDRSISRINSYDDHNIRLLNNGTINRSMDRSYMLNSSFIVRNHSQISLPSINNSLSRNTRNAYIPSLSRSHMSTISRNEEPDISIITDAPSMISVENIVPPSVRYSQRIDNFKNEEPTIHKVEVSYSIDDIPDDVEIKDEIEEDIFMRPSMVRYVEVEPGPVIQQAETTRISYISSQSSEVPQILDQELLDSFKNDDDDNDDDEEKNNNSSEKGDNNNDNIKEVNLNEKNEVKESSKELTKELLKIQNNTEDDEEITAKNDRLESPLTVITTASPSSFNHEMIIKPEDTEIINTDNDKMGLLKNNTSISEDEDISSSTLNENTITCEILKLENNQSHPKIEKRVEKL